MWILSSPYCSHCEFKSLRELAEKGCDLDVREELNPQGEKIYEVYMLGKNVAHYSHYETRGENGWKHEDVIRDFLKTALYGNLWKRGWHIFKEEGVTNPIM